MTASVSVDCVHRGLHVCSSAEHNYECTKRAALCQQPSNVAILRRSIQFNIVIYNAHMVSRRAEAKTQAVAMGEYGEAGLRECTAKII